MRLQLQTEPVPEICTPTTASAKLAPRSAATSSSTISVGRMRALTAPHPIKPTSLRCRSAWQPNLGRGFTYRCGKSVQTTGTTSDQGSALTVPPPPAEQPAMQQQQQVQPKDDDKKE